MTRPRIALLFASFCAVLGGCGATASMPGDVVGPYTGTPIRFVVDSLLLPLTDSQLADDLDNAGRKSNHLGIAVGTLTATFNVAQVAPLLTGGRIAPELAIVSDDMTLRTDPTVGVIWTGEPGGTATTIGGDLQNGVFHSNLARSTTHPITARVVLPVLADADPLVLDVQGAEIELTPDAQGQGPNQGWTGQFNGGVDGKLIADELFRALTQMVAANPEEHRTLMLLLDNAPRDGVITRKEFDDAPLVESLLTLDLTLHDPDGTWHPHHDPQRLEAISIGFGFHVARCPVASGRCAALPAPSCFDRIKNGGETDIDCGGLDCRVCPSGLRCSVITDCDTGMCKQGICGAATCTDGIRNGFESDVDCGGYCKGCTKGFRCLLPGDCAAGSCDSKGGVSEPIIPGHCI